jgi:hypothetical protein
MLEVVGIICCSLFLLLGIGFLLVNRGTVRRAKDPFGLTVGVVLCVASVLAMCAVLGGCP